MVNFIANGVEVIHTDLKELMCQCGRHKVSDFSWEDFDPQLLAMFELAREEMNKPRVFHKMAEIPLDVRAARCWDHHVEVCQKYGLPLTEKSPHIWKKGKTLVSGMDAKSRLSMAALYLVFERINPWGLGRYNDHIHFDTMKRAQRSRWIAISGKYHYLS